MKNNALHILFLGCLCCTAYTSYGQKELDSLIRVTYVKVYEAPSEVIKEGNQIFDIATDDGTKARALMLVSTAYLSRRENEKSLEYTLKSKEYFDGIDDVTSKIQILNAVGMQYQQLQIYDEAIVYLDEALALTKTIKDNDSISLNLGYNYAIRGFIYREQMSCEIAINYLDKAISEYKKTTLNRAANANLSTLSYNKGNCMLQISQIDSARVNYNNAIQYAQAIGAKSLFAFAKKGLGESYIATGDYEKSVSELKEAEEASKNVGDLVLNLGIYKNLSDNYLALNNRELYVKYNDLYLDVQKRINKKQEATINHTLYSLIEESKLQSQNELKKLSIIKMILIGLCVLLFLILGNYALKNKKTFFLERKKTRQEL